jgi:hypothetical protein
MTSKVTIEYKITGRNGKERYRGKKICDSFVENFHAVLFSSFSGNDVTVIDTSGLPRMIRADGVFDTQAPANVTTYGILVGTESTPTTATDYTMGNVIPNGVTSGTVQYNTTTPATVTIEGDSVILSIRRVFVNYSPTPVTVREIGLCMRTMHGMEELHILLLRDIFEPGILMVPFENISFKLKIKTYL